LICNSADLAARTIEDDPAPPPLAVIYNGVDLARFGPAPLPAHPTVTVVANLIAYKRHDRFLDALQIVRRSIPEVRAILVGDGPERRSIEAKISTLDLWRSVRMVGAVEDITPYVREARVISLASDHEGFPNALLEGMAMARPVVATSAGGIPELVTDGIEGLTCALTPDGLALGLESVLSTPGLAETMGPAARRRAESFGWERVVDQTEGLYARVIAGKAYRRGVRVI
jgi:glycosyltransferase involved in cell wall biosynthesis